MGTNQVLSGGQPVASVLRRLMRWFNDPAREAARLSRDARYVLEQVVAYYPAEQAAQVALCLNENLIEARDAIGAAPSRRLDIVREVQRRHRAARRRNDQPSLSGLTLVLIGLHADELGEAGGEIRRTIQAFLEQWDHVTVDTADKES